jgi:hypothetical protein
MAFARAALTRMKGLTPLIFMTAVKLKVVMGTGEACIRGGDLFNSLINSLKSHNGEHCATRQKEGPSPQLQFPQMGKIGCDVL